MPPVCAEPRTGGYAVKDFEISEIAEDLRTGIRKVSLTGVTTSDIQGIVDATSFAAGLAPVDVVSSLPTSGNFEGRVAMLTTNGKLHRYHSGAWTVAVDGGDLVYNSVTTGALAAGAVTAAQLAAGAVTARHMGIGDFENLNIDANFLDPEAWTGETSLYAPSNPEDWGSAKIANIVGDGNAYTVVSGTFAFDIDATGEEFWLSWNGRDLPPRNRAIQKESLFS